MIQRWIEALRSGKYKPTSLLLRNDDSFHPLGVLLDVEGAVWSVERGRYVAVLPDGTRFRNIVDVIYWLQPSDHAITAAVLNDKHGLSFSSIAEVLEDAIQT